VAAKTVKNPKGAGRTKGRAGFRKDFVALPTDDENFIGIEANNKSAEATDEEDRQFEDSFFPKPPDRVDQRHKKLFSQKNKRARFLQSYNAYCGNESRAMFDAGIKRSEMSAWYKEPEFAAKICELKLEISDRVKYVLFERIGLIKPRVGLARISENLLLKAAMGLNKELFGNDSEGTVHLHIAIPRPDDGPGDPAGLRPDAQADQVPHLPS